MWLRGVCGACLCQVACFRPCVSPFSHSIPRFSLCPPPHDIDCICRIQLIHSPNIYFLSVHSFIPAVTLCL
jgi:hypothetical protein